MTIDLADYEQGAKYKGDYEADLAALQQRLAKIQVAHILHGKRSVILLEGWDAAGKGGIIKRMSADWDPRYYQVHPISAPTQIEQDHHFLWRFWTRLPASGNIAVFDRSWYGRVLVERVEGFASDVEWQRAYDEINRFEKDLYDSQTIVVKFWLAISKDEQAVRFKAREETPHKRFKITEEDWRNRGRWDDYLKAAADMLERTHTGYAPWHVIATNDKNTARLEILRAIVKQLKSE